MAAPACLSILNRVADSYIRRGVVDGFGYGEATLYSGLEAVLAVNYKDTIYDWYKNKIDNGVITDGGEIRDWNLTFYSLDEYRIGVNLLYWYDQTGDEKYKTAADTIRHQIDRHPRNELGGLWHRAPIYKNQQWLDGIFMADTFYALWTHTFEPDNTTAWDDIVLQFDLIEEKTRNHTTNLLVHGYDSGKEAIWADPVTGASPLVWGRAVGWYYMALAEVIQLFPESHEGHARLVEYFVTLSQGLKRAAEVDGGWWLVMSEPYPGKPRNYIESSAHAMFSFGLLHGLRKGLLQEDEYGVVAEKSYRDLVGMFVEPNDDGTLDFIETVQVGSLNSNATFEYYTGVPRVINDDRGGGALLLAASEWELRIR
ncbi:cell wall glycosyl hydrolase YteR [Emericellopsis atlantica]|uniref:Cell wall glycosyl hydrolase YteR n=1 Tax=Emericellopsis atlantica TaxID=2614577 RepID=A0A9P8CR67_9HYPO|nr:cell wall glycosyl hydrolase YteR [Emericellopsis atlantica]KAG9254401.1 cell wall glycosyl hydrolase YteR [Emericellopsis atlantica]